MARGEPVVRKPRETIKPVVVKAAEAPLFEVFEAKSAPPQEERVEVRFSMSKENFEALEEVKAQLSTKLGKALTLEALVVKLVELQRNRKTRNVKPTSPESRYVPKAVRRELHTIHKGQCCYCAPDGTRCTERNYLQVDRIVPFAVHRTP